ncbi:hypothetical protein [Streptomyces fuscichromogenes]|uniref:hypothetical protein n=1 Tax=Streptomyces fuscichromogenes TaxID=1324013 RepID=UPI001670267B|nr:hypothetical protein [Streptomyces fuscichromogenes]
MVFTLSGWMPGGGGEVLGVGLATRTSTTPGAHDIGIWRLSLDGRAVWERLTYFTAFDGHGVNQPVISPTSGGWSST